jgi:sigma-B regulation protein RsbU (phosphoserine phosphatase)
MSADHSVHDPSKRNKRLAMLFLLLGVVLVMRGGDIYCVLQDAHLGGITPLPNIDKGRLVFPDVPARVESVASNPLHQAGVRKGDILIAIRDSSGRNRTIANWSDFYSSLRGIPPDGSWSMTVSRTADGREQRLTLTVPPVPPEARRFRSRAIELALGLGVPLVAILTGFFIGFAKPDDNNAFVGCLLFVCFSSLVIVERGALPTQLRILSTLLQVSFNIFTAYLFYRFFLFFPSRSVIDRKAPWLKTLFLAFTLLNWSLSLFLTILANISFVAVSRWTDSLSILRIPSTVVLAAMMIGAIAALVLNTVQARSRNEKRRLAILLWGTLLGLFPLISVAIVFTILKRTMPFWLVVILIATLTAFPLSFAYVVLRHQVLDIRVIIRRGLRYALISRAFLLLEGILIFLILYFSSQIFVHRLFPGSGQGVIFVFEAIATILAVTALRVLNRRIMPVIDRRFFRDAYDAQRILTDLSRAVRNLSPEPRKLLDLVTERISSSLYPSRTAIFLKDALPSETAGESTIRWIQPPTGTFNCCSYREITTANLQMDRPATPIALTSNSLIAGYLKNVSGQEPEPIEVYLHDPRSWAHSLMRTDSRTEDLLREQQLVETLDMRLLIPMLRKGEVSGFISLGQKLSEEPYSREDKELLLTVTEQAATALDYSQMIGQIAEQEKMKRELQIAKEVQTRLFPRTLPPSKGLSYTGICHPARGVGGDYYDFLKLTEHKLAIALGDVSGKGISSALLMASLNALLRSHAPLYIEDLPRLIDRINRLMCDSTESSKYATFFYSVFDERDRTLAYVNAGHNPPMLFRSSGPPSDVVRLRTGGMVVGMLEEATYEQSSVQMNSGDVLIIYTDGITEQTDINEEEFGEERLMSVVRANLSGDPEFIRDRVLETVAAFMGEAPQNDDLTLVVAKLQ